MLVLLLIVFSRKFSLLDILDSVHIVFWIYQSFFSCIFMQINLTVKHLNFSSPSWNSHLSSLKITENFFSFLLLWPFLFLDFSHNQAECQHKFYTKVLFSKSSSFASPAKDTSWLVFFSFVWVFTLKDFYFLFLLQKI